MGIYRPGDQDCKGPIGKIQDEKEMNVKAYIARDPSGVCRVFVKRAKHKHWFELGQHRETDTAFERALMAGAVVWKPGIVDRTQLFCKKT